MLVETRSGCVNENLVGRCIEPDRARWSASIGRKVGVQLASGVGEEVPRHGGGIAGPEAEGAWEGLGIIFMWVGVVLLLQSIVLPLEGDEYWRVQRRDTGRSYLKTSDSAVQLAPDGFTRLPQSTIYSSGLKCDSEPFGRVWKLLFLPLLLHAVPRRMQQGIRTQVWQPIPCWCVRGSWCSLRLQLGFHKGWRECQWYAGDGACAESSSRSRSMEDG